MEICERQSSKSPEMTNSIVASGVAGKRFHFIGAGGIGMSGLAKLLIKNNGVVSGSDELGSSVTEMLCGLGACINIGHDRGNLSEDVDAVVISAAIAEDNPELVLAREKGFRIIKYSEMLGEMMDLYDGIAISGTHGKSTSSGWLVYCLDRAGLEPNYLIGGDVPQLGGSSGVGDSKLFIAEACEYDRSFLNLRPQTAAILNIEQDHLDYYGDVGKIIEAFTDYANCVRVGGTLIANGEDANVAKVLEGVREDIRCVTFGLDCVCTFSAANLRLVEGLYHFDIYHDGLLLGPAKAALPGEHNVMNALAVTALGINAGLEPREIVHLLGGFSGVDRRLMFKGIFGGVTVLDDYAHHPTEIRASLGAIRQLYEPDKLWCVFQPHQYSRTRYLLDDFSCSFGVADMTLIPEIYFVRDHEESKRFVNSQLLVERINSRGAEAKFVDGFVPICDYLEKHVSSGDVVVTMGAGDIWKVADEYIQRLGRNS